MNSVFSFSELGSIFEDARADFSANFRAARAVRGLPSGNYRLRIVSCVFSGTPGREHISFRLEVTSGPFCGRRLNHSIYVFSVNPQQRRRELTRLRNASGRLRPRGGASPEHGGLCREGIRGRPVAACVRGGARD